MTESELAALTRIIDELNESTVDLTVSSAEQTKVQSELREELAGVKSALPSFVPKRRFRWAIALMVLAGLAVLALVLLFRERDADEAQRRRAQLELDLEQDRQSEERRRQDLLRGCERNNDQRAALRRVIERAYTPSAVPDGVSAELRDLILQSQERMAALRTEQLADPGVQPVDCAAQFPPLRETA